MCRSMLVCLVCILATPISTVYAADDAIRRSLDEAKAEYEEKLEKYQTAVTTWFEKREEAARKIGDKKAVDLIKAERQAFVENGDLPKTSPASLKSQLSSARLTIEIAYKSAVREYTKLKQDDEAAAIEKELEAFLSGMVTGDQWVSLFNGKDLTGWKQHPDTTGKWTVEDGAIVGRGIDQSHLFTDRGDYTNFHIRVEAKINATGNSGVCFRTNYFGVGRLKGNGYEVNIEGDKSHRLQTGSLMHIAPAGEIVQQVVKPGQWFEMEVIAIGPRTRVLINGRLMVDFTDLNNTYERGYLALQQLGDKTEAHFRKVELKILPENK